MAGGDAAGRKMPAQHARWAGINNGSEVELPQAGGGSAAMRFRQMLSVVKGTMSATSAMPLMHSK